MSFSFIQSLQAAPQRYSDCCHDAGALVLNAGLWELGYGLTLAGLESYMRNLARLGLEIVKSIRFFNNSSTKSDSRNISKRKLIWRATTPVNWRALDTWRQGWMSNYKIRAWNSVALQILSSLGFLTLDTNGLFLADFGVNNGESVSDLWSDGYHPRSEVNSLMVDLMLDRVCSTDGMSVEDIEGLSVTPVLDTQR
jgi:hypothetical protein